MSSPALSVCVINFNYGRFLRDAIDSALAQGEGIEVVVVDDGSTDDSRSVIEGYGDRVVAVFKENGGQGSAFNAAIAASTGDALLFLDADDVLEPGIGASVIEAFAADPQVVKVQFRMRIVDADNNPTDRLVPHRRGVLPSGDLSDHVVRFRSYPWPPSSAMAYRRAALEKLLPVPEERHVNGCCDAWLSELLPVLGPVRSLDEVGARYRRHGANDFAGTTLEPRWLRNKIELTRAAHAELVVLAAKEGIVGVPPDAEAALDAAYAGFRVASLVLEPDHHPVPGDRRPLVAVRGARAALLNPHYGLRQTVARLVWFCVAGLTPRRLARGAVLRWVPDGPQPPPWERPPRRVAPSPAPVA